MNDKVVVSREWNNPEIHVFVSQKEVGADMDLDVFLRTLVEVVGHPTWMMTKAQLLTKVMEAKERVVMEMKKATVHV